MSAHATYLAQNGRAVGLGLIALDGTGVNQFLTPKSYVRLTAYLPITEGCGVNCTVKYWVIACQARLSRQDYLQNEWVSCVFGVPGCTLFLYFGPDLLLEPALIARIIALALAAMLAFAAGTVNSSAAFATDAFPGTTIAGSSGSFTDSNTGATGQAGEPTTFGGGSLNTIWYSWTAPASGVVVAGTCNPTASVTTNFDTTLGVYTGNAVNALTVVTTNDDTTGCNSTVNANYGSTVTFNATAGTTYRFQVDGYTNATGNYHFHYGLVSLAVTTTDGQATEGGDTGAFTVRLSTVPTANVTVTIGASTQCTFAPTTLTFTLANWNAPQTVTATAINDTVVEGTHSCAPAAITASGGSFNTATGTPPVITIIDNDVASFTITKAVNAASIAAPGTLTYTISIANTGNVPLTAPVITDSLSQGGALTLTTGPTLTSGDAAPLGTLNVGETWIYTATYLVTQANINNGTAISNVASFDTAETPLATSNTAATTITQSPAMTVVKAADTAGPVSAGTVITYTFTVKNTGNVTLSNIVLADVHNGFGTPPAPANEVLFSDAAPLGDSTDLTPNNGTWTTLAPGDQVKFTAPYSVVQQDVDLLQ